MRHHPKNDRTVARCAAVAAALALTLGAAGAEIVDAATPSVPLRATFAGAAHPLSMTVTEFTGSGDATLLGLVSTAGTAVVTGAGDSCIGGVANLNTETLTGPSGDSVTITSSDVACPVGAGVYAATGTWTITGGTGRFAGSTGAGRLQGSADFVAGRFVIALDGNVQLMH